jgi:hypothetical protein
MVLFYINHETRSRYLINIFVIVYQIKRMLVFQTPLKLKKLPKELS